MLKLRKERAAFYGLDRPQKANIPAWSKEHYIAAAEPVGSKAMAEEMGGSSSATIRNELADLVEMGYLEQPHTSAGRVPSRQRLPPVRQRADGAQRLSETEAEEINEQLK